MIASTIPAGAIRSSVRERSVAVQTAPRSGMGPAGVMMPVLVTAMSPMVTSGWPGAEPTASG
ncbi:hypothetical protein F7Q99_13600 [Streptomyces kaniharaensis]|uniref:Uncharacterized protein n=1 Tax=Streptomyces kaniharaensis TaxID=212423 RepID=A0A6N7KRS4_9ACTN|nr:hypothetical protein [Streptomyces kaniharaensis]